MNVQGLPAGWATARLDDLAEVRLGRQRSPKNHTGDHMRPYLRAANLTWQGIDVSDVKEMNFTDDEVATYRLQDGDILLSEASGSASEVGKPGVWSGQLGGDMCFQNTLLRVRPASGLQSRFLYYRFLHEAVGGGFSASSRGVGIHHLGAAKLAGLTIAVAPLAEQRRIVLVLDEALQKLREVHEDVGRLSQRLSGVLARVLAEELRAAHHPLEALQGLLAKPLINGRSVPTLPGGFPVLRLTALRTGTVDVSESKPGDWTRDEACRWLVEPNDFLVARGNGSLHLVGRGALVASCPENEVAFPDTVIRVRVDPDRYRPRFLRLIWHTRAVREQIEEAARTTAGIFKVNQRNLEKVLLPVPPLDVQDAIIEVADRTADSLRPLAAQLHRLDAMCSAMQRSLLRCALEGKLVPQDSMDDPADLILARIRERRKASVATARVAKEGTVRKTTAKNTKEKSK